MRSIVRLSSVGLLVALVVATFVACKREKEQNGPSIIIPNEQGVIAGDITLPADSNVSVRFKLVFQKGSGKDDADLKDFSFTFNLGGGLQKVFENRPVANGTSFTFDTTFSIRGNDRDQYTYTFTIRDKNDKTASKSFRITFQRQGTQPPAGRFFTGTITLDTSSTPFIYLATNGIEARSLSNLSEASNVIAALIVRRVTHDTNKVSLVTPDSLGKGNYAPFGYINWTASSKPQTTFYDITESQYNQATDSSSIASVVDAANTPTAFINNGSGARALLDGTPASSTSGPHQYLAFRQQQGSSRIWGVIKRQSVSGSTVTLEVKAIRR